MRIAASGCSVEETVADESLLRVANESFYKAFRERDVAAMGRLWAHGRPLLCVHPGARPLYARAAILASWEGLLHSANCPRLEYRVERILHCGLRVAYRRRTPSLAPDQLGVLPYDTRQLPVQTHWSPRVPRRAAADSIHSR